jgi:hypothetical protein
MTTSFTELQKVPQFRSQSENGAWLSTKHMVASTSSPRSMSSSTKSRHRADALADSKDTTKTLAK